MFPRISIVTPSYNQGRFIEQTIKSVLNQEYPNLEYIIIDGGSSDSSVDIIKKYANRLAYWVSERDRGQSDAINKGFRRCTGDILSFLNSDDRLCPGALKTVADFFNSNPARGAVIGDLEVIDPEGRVVATKKSIPVHYWSMLYSTCSVPQPATFFTREAWAKTGEIDVSIHYNMDVEFFLRMMLCGVTFGTLKVPLAQFRLHRQSKTVSQYHDLVWASNRLIQDRFLGIQKRGPLRKAYMDVMNWVARGYQYALRAVTRGALIPFTDTRARRRVVTS